jgi:N-acylglucosamine-6-phosphate 2-epimerase
MIQKMKGGLVVSCQAYRGEPFFGSDYMVEFARCAMAGGAVGIRANGPEDVGAIAKSIALPVIGLFKMDLPGFKVRITPNLNSAIQIAQQGAQIIALDATRREHPDGFTPAGFIQAVHEKTRLPVLADISTFDEGLAAQDAGAAAVSTTLSGYTDYSPQQDGPDLDLVERLSHRLSIPVFAEGRITSGSEARKALDLGAHAVIVGTAITRPQWIVEQMIKSLHSL